MQHVCGQILVIITHRPHLYLQGQCNFLPCVHREGRWRNPVKKGHADYLLAIRHVRVCVCVVALLEEGVELFGNISRYFNSMAQTGHLHYLS